LKERGEKFCELNLKDLKEREGEKEGAEKRGKERTPTMMDKPKVHAFWKLDFREIAKYSKVPPTV